MPPGTVVRRHFSREPGEKILRNWAFRQFTNRMLARRYRTADFFFSLPPLAPRKRLEGIFSPAKRFVVEVETHPINAEEYRFLIGSEIRELIGNVPLASRFALPESRCHVLA